MEKNNYFVELNSINVNEHTEKKNNLTYLSWAWAWAEVKKLHPEAIYTIYENANGMFYHTDGKTCWVKTGVTVNGIEHIEYLPVMDYKNNSIPAERVTSFDVNKAIQRSLTKACARHGLGLYVYAGEDLPEVPSEAPAKENIYEMPEMKEMKNAVDTLVDNLGLDKETMNITPISPYAEPKKKTTKKVVEKPVEAPEAPAVSDGEVKNTIAIIKGFRSRTELKAYIDEHPQYAEYRWFQNNCNEQWKKIGQ